MEIWRNIKGHEELYQVSNLGNVKSLNRYVKGKIYQNIHFKPGNSKSVIPDSKGYFRVCLWKNNKRELKRIHHLVALAFPEICGEWFEGCEVDHINGNKTDNRAVNLRVCTHTENMNNPITLERKRKKVA